MACKFIIVAVIGCLFSSQLIHAKAVSNPPKKSELEELTVNVQNLVHNVTTSMGFKELPDSKHIVETLHRQVQTFANNIDEVVNKLKSEVKAHQGDADNVIKSVQNTLTETVNSLQKIAGPEASSRAKEIKTNLDNGLKSTVSQVDKLIKVIEPDATKAGNDIKNIAKTLIDHITEVGNNLQKQVKASITEHEKTHKH